MGMYLQHVLIWCVDNVFAPWQNQQWTGTRPSKTRASRSQRARASVSTATFPVTWLPPALSRHLIGPWRKGGMGEVVVAVEAVVEAVAAVLDTSSTSRRDCP